MRAIERCGMLVIGLLVASVLGANVLAEDPGKRTEGAEPVNKVVTTKARQSIDLKEEFRIIGRTGQPLHRPFRAKFAPDGDRLKLIAVNGTELKAPILLRWRSQYSRDYLLEDAYTGLDGHADEARRGQEVLAWETGVLMPQKPEADPPNRCVLEFRSLIVLERSVRADISLPDYPVVKNAIPVDELTRERTIKGLLSPELGTWVSIKGKWSGSDNFKAGFTAWKFQILEVNGEKFEYSREVLESATRLDLTLGDIGPCPPSGRQLRKPQDAEIWEFEAYESFHYDAMVNSKEVSSVRMLMTGYPRGPGPYTELRMRVKDAERLEKLKAAAAK